MIDETVKVKKFDKTPIYNIMNKKQQAKCTNHNRKILICR